MKLGKNYPECGKPESVRQIWYILTYELIINYKIKYNPKTQRGYVTRKPQKGVHASHCEGERVETILVIREGLWMSL